MFRFTRSGWLLFFALATSGNPAVAGKISVSPPTMTLRGHIAFVSANSRFSAPNPADTVVFFQPDTAIPVNPVTSKASMATENYAFVPHVLTVTVGTSVRFPNDDPIFHNVFSPSAPNAFDLGLYGTNPGKTVTFQHQGLVRVYCNVHHYMFAYILVVDTPYFTGAQPDGGFALRALPAQPGELTIWNPQTRVWRQHLSGAPDGPLDVSLSVITGGIPQHLNKNGKPYFQFHGPGV